VNLRKLEKDINRREVALANKQEERQGAREAMKCAMGDLRKIIKDGPGLFEEEGAESEPTGAGKAPEKSRSSATSTASPSTATTDLSAAKSASTSAQKNATPHPTKSPASPAASPTTPDDPIKSALASTTCAEVLGDDLPLAKEGLDAVGIITLSDAASKGKSYLIRNGNLHPNLAQRIFDKIHAIRHPEEVPVGA
jgi:hypothetical protein